jgi:hypothetical protein
MVVATFKEGVTQDEIRELIPAEQAQAKVLEEKGLLGVIKVAMPRRSLSNETMLRLGMFSSLESCRLSGL